MKTLSMKPLALTLMPLLLLGACSSATPNYDSKFGLSVLQARQNMIINPEAGKEPDVVAGIEGKQAVNALTQYERSFAPVQQPATPRIISIGNLATQGQGGQGR